MVKTMKKKKQNICIGCNEREIHNKKRSLCERCYKKERRKNGPFIKGKDHKYKTEKLNLRARLNRELEFVKNYFTHNDWIQSPATFRIYEFKYSPDFYDARRNVFIEVAGSRQAFHANKGKYELFTKLYPKIMLEVRTIDGQLLSEKSVGDMWTTQYATTVKRRS